MVISAGEGLHASVASPDSAWLDALAESDRRVWLTPVSDSRLWPAALQRVPLPIVPMTRRGLVEAASLLAHAERIGTGVSSRMVHEERRATTGDVRRIKRLASLVPFPTVSLLELLRQQFAEDVPEAAVIYATGGTTLGGDLPFRMTDEEIRDLTGEMRREQPALEAKVREYLLRVLHESEPPDGSAAHYRWEASTAIQQLQLARLQQTDSTAPAEAVRQLGRGPLWEEVRVALARQPAVPGLPTKPPAASPADPPPLIAVVSGTAPFKWRWPRAADLAASLVLALLAGTLVGFTPVARRTVSHRSGGYFLDYRVDGSNQGALSVRLRDDSGVPLTVQLYRDDRAFGPALTLDRQVGASTTIDLAAGAHVFQARAVLPDGALAVSNSIWAPSTLVVINAQPWARVTISSSDRRVSAAETTPVALRLPVGDYTMSFENGGITPASTQQVRVTAPGPQLVNEPMDSNALDLAMKRLSVGAGLAGPLRAMRLRRCDVRQRRRSKPRPKRQAFALKQTHQVSPAIYRWRISGVAADRGSAVRCTQCRLTSWRGRDSPSGTSRVRS